MARRGGCYSLAEAEGRETAAAAAAAIEGAETIASFLGAVAAIAIAPEAEPDTAGFLGSNAAVDGVAEERRMAAVTRSGQLAEDCASCSSPLLSVLVG